MSCEARTHGSGEVLCAKNTFFLVYAVNRNDPSLPTALLAGVSTMKGTPVLFSVFGYDNCWPELAGTKTYLMALSFSCVHRPRLVSTYTNE